MQHIEILKIGHIQREHLFDTVNFEKFEQLMNWEMILCSKLFLSTLSCNTNFKFMWQPLLPKEAKKFLHSHCSGCSTY